MALGSLAAIVTIQSLLFAFFLGGLFARVKRIETDHTDNSALALAVATLTANVGAMKEQLGEVRDMIMERQPARRRTPET